MLIATPVSHLFKEYARDIAALSDVLELRDHNQDYLPAWKGDLILHSEFNILARWANKEVECLTGFKRFNLKAISFHILSQYQEQIIKEDRFIGDGKPYTRSELLTNAAENVLTVRKILGNIPILAENINHLMTDSYDIVTEPEFISELIAMNEIYLLFDIAHAKITCFNRKESLEYYICKLPLNRIIQIHVSKESYQGGEGIDTHAVLVDSDWEYLEHLALRLPNLRYLTLEYYKDKDLLLSSLKTLRHVISKVRHKFVIEDLQWDTNFFGLKIGRIYASNDAPLNEILAAKKLGGYGCLYLLSDIIIRNISFNYVDSKLDYMRTLEHIGDRDIFFAQQSDLAVIKHIASYAFRGMSRFYRDNHFKKELADELYIRWIDKLDVSESSKVLVVKENGKVCGFLGITIKDGVGIIELIAVAKEHTGKGIGIRLIESAFHYLHSKQIKTVTVSTQEDNLAAKSLYLKTGFKLYQKRYWYHIWK